MEKRSYQFANRAYKLKIDTLLDKGGSGLVRSGGWGRGQDRGRGSRSRRRRPQKERQTRPKQETHKKGKKRRRCPLSAKDERRLAACAERIGRMRPVQSLPRRAPWNVFQPAKVDDAQHIVWEWSALGKRQKGLKQRRSRLWCKLRITFRADDGYFYSFDEETIPYPAYIMTADDDSDMQCRRAAKQTPANSPNKPAGCVCICRVQDVV